MRVRLTKAGSDCSSITPSSGVDDIHDGERRDCGADRKRIGGDEMTRYARTDERVDHDRVRAAVGTRTQRGTAVGDAQFETRLPAQAQVHARDLEHALINLEYLVA